MSPIYLKGCRPDSDPGTANPPHRTWNAVLRVWYLSAFVGAVILCGIAIAAVDCHDNLSRDNNCPACVFSAHLSSGSGASVPDLPAPSYISLSFDLEGPAASDRIAGTVLNSRAPPGIPSPLKRRGSVS